MWDMTYLAEVFGLKSKRKSERFFQDKDARETQSLMAALSVATAGNYQ